MPLQPEPASKSKQATAHELITAIALPDNRVAKRPASADGVAAASRDYHHWPPAKGGTPERSRTSNLLIRSQVLYPIELRVLSNGRGR